MPHALQGLMRKTWWEFAKNVIALVWSAQAQKTLPALNVGKEDSSFKNNVSFGALLVTMEK